MGLNFSAQVNQGLIEYFKTLKTDDEVSFGVHKHNKEFSLNEASGMVVDHRLNNVCSSKTTFKQRVNDLHCYKRDFSITKFSKAVRSLVNSKPSFPKCKILLQDLFLKFPEDLELVEDGSDPLINLTNCSVVKAPRIVILIGKAQSECDMFGCSVRISGKIEICDVFLTSNYTPVFGDGLKIGACDLKFTAKKVESDIQLFINNNNYSSIVNAFLSSDNPFILNWIVNAILIFLKDKLMEEMNTHLGTIQPF